MIHILHQKKTPLERIITYITKLGFSFTKDKLLFYYKLINLLLGYVENITEKAFEFARESKYSNEIIKILNHNQDILNQAKTNPTEDLLFEAVGFNKPFIGQLIVDEKPEFVSHYLIALADLTSPFSVPTLKHALRIQKFRESELVQEQLPVEVVERIEKFTGN